MTEYCKKGHYCDGMNIIPCPPGRSANARQENSCVECDRGKQRFYFGLYGFLFLYRSIILIFLSFFSSIFSFSTNINFFKVNTVSVLVLRLATNALQHVMAKVVDRSYVKSVQPIPFLMCQVQHLRQIVMHVVQKLLLIWSH